MLQVFIHNADGINIFVFPVFCEHTANAAYHQFKFNTRFGRIIQFIDQYFVTSELSLNAKWQRAFLFRMADLAVHELQQLPPHAHRAYQQCFTGVQYRHPQFRLFEISENAVHIRHDICGRQSAGNDHHKWWPFFIQVAGADKTIMDGAVIHLFLPGHNLACTFILGTPSNTFTPASSSSFSIPGWLLLQNGPSVPAPRLPVCRFSPHW